ncbi:MAG: hypothetical protein IJR85_10790 [Synergistaceae bacterium]|nr:hypothetical protein [Synergistaceae bacterium]
MSVDFLVGYTGFVGSNLAEQHSFDGLFSSANISEAWGAKPDLLVYAGVRSEMFIANKYPEQDRQIIASAEENISRINAKKTVLISTAAVYPNPDKCDEDTDIDISCLPPYGANRYALEKWTENTQTAPLIVRLPAIFGKNLRKNFIYDLIHEIPSLLTEAKFAELSAKAPELKGYYVPQDNGFLKCRALSGQETATLKNTFRKLGFTALNFTDSRSVYQFYSLGRLWQDIVTALSHGLRLLNLATPPVNAGELHKFLTGRDFVNELGRKPYSYDTRTKYAEFFGGSEGYIMSLEQELSDIRDFVKENML